MKTPPTSDHDTRSYVLAWRLKGRKVLIVGGGDIGTAKMETFAGTGALLHVVDPTPSSRVTECAQRGELELSQRRFRPTDLWGASLVVAATGSVRVNTWIHRWAQLFRVVVNAVDDPDRCDVTVPAVIHRGPATVAITTGGATPAGARFLREVLTDVVEATVPPGTGHLLDAARELRSDLRHQGRYRYDYRAWRTHLFEPGLSAVHRGEDLDTIVEQFVTHFDAGGAPPVGRVTLVGAGPGGADLITLRGARALAAADVVLYDRLADPKLLEMAPVAADRIPVGKAKGSGMTQSAINALLVERAMAGDHVVRLKGGDPFVFGRGGEEVEALAAAGVVVDVVPGVSSALAAPLLAGVSVTDRRCASSFAVMTGHRATDGDLAIVDPDVASETTLVVLMASSTASTVAQKFTERGWNPETLVAFVHAAGTPRQKRAVLPLADVQQKGCPFPAPTVMLVGPTVERLVPRDLRRASSAMTTT